MRTGHEFDLTVWDLLQGSEDVSRLAGEESGPEAWDEVNEWPRTRLTAALVAAIGALADHHDGPDARPRRYGQVRPLRVRPGRGGHTAGWVSVTGDPGQADRSASGLRSRWP